MRNVFRILAIAACLYLVFAAHRYYVEHHPDPRDNPCSCDECDCVSDLAPAEESRK